MYTHYICRLLLVLSKFDCSCPPSACIYSMRHHDVNPAYPLMKLLWQATLWKARSNLRGHQIGFWSEFATWLETLNQSDHSNNRHKPVVTERVRDRLVPACHFIISVVWYTQITLELDSRQDTRTPPEHATVALFYEHKKHTQHSQADVSSAHWFI